MSMVISQLLQNFSKNDTVPQELP